LKLQEFLKIFLQNGALNFFKPVAKKEKITENFENIFLKYPLKRIFQKLKLTKISSYMVSSVGALIAPLGPLAFRLFA